MFDETEVKKKADFFMEIGRALSTWARVEDTLCLIFCHCINPEQSNPADKAFWAIMSFEAKVQATSEVFGSTFPKFDSGSTDAIRAKWTNIKNRLLRRNHVRNKVAHGSVVTLHWVNKRGKQISTFFAPFYYSQRTNPKSLKEFKDPDWDARPKEHYTVEQVREFANSFVEAKEEIWELFLEITERRKHWPKPKPKASP